MTHTDRFRYLVDWIPMSVCFHQDGGATLLVALESYGDQYRVHRTLSKVDPDAYRRVWVHCGSSPGWVGWLKADVSDQMIAHSYLHIVACERVASRPRIRRPLNGLTWVSITETPAELRRDLLACLQSQIELDPLFPCRFLPPTWTAAEYRRVREVILGKPLDPSNGRKYVQWLERLGVVRHLSTTIPTKTRPAGAYTVCVDLRRVGGSWLYLNDDVEGSP